MAPGVPMPMRALCALVLFLLAPLAPGAARAGEGADTPAVDKPRQWSVRLHPDARLTYQGVATFDAAGMGGGPMQYPAPNLGGFLAAIIAHGLMVESVKKVEKIHLQQQADKVLDDYRPLLDRFGPDELLQRAVAQTATPGAHSPTDADGSPAAWQIEVAPTFSMTQDSTALVLDNALVIRRPGMPDTAGHPYGVRVVSSPVAETDARAYWSDDDGEKLKDTSARLLAESLDVALSQVERPTRDGRHKTFRYLEGASTKMERAELIEDRCERVVIRTLRGWLMSVPVAPTPDRACKAEAEAGAEQ